MPSSKMLWFWLLFNYSFFGKFSDFSNLIQPELPKVVFAAHLEVVVSEVETEMARSRKLRNCRLDCIFWTCFWDLFALHSRYFTSFFFPSATTLSEKTKIRPVTAKSVTALSYLLVGL